MSFELEQVLCDTEDFLRRAIGSPTRRAAKQRRMRRRLEEFGRRAKRSAFVFTALLALLVAFAFVSPLSLLLWIVALPTILLIAGVLMFQPTRHARRLEAEARAAPESLPLAGLVVRAEEALLDRCSDLPGRALPAVDRIIASLRELQPHLAAVGPRDEALAGEVRRLAGRHLPQLVDSWSALPASARAPRSESSRRVTESLGIVADELDHLLARCCRGVQGEFDTQSRFIEARYREDERLRGE